ncbi:predicted protein [Chaetomium globosum CBS 148.51]|uniref:Uncharacterized protein n=1 Tax=Chaetomium globosum (strain ATCC 6205 / CBS 148.51 / DSM 1962 / NBRC 6347 / NRRL 1970) TaxID=306901 RepID=Q2H3N7_CHAGB|nr:uncharacterized protein CHGG_06728 [Chaetomium globosum CBS 148.51]EAQ90109.1 predicted protein [Chaetomium globosum CBS 148.51]
MPGVSFAAVPIAYQPNKSTSPLSPSTPRAAPGPQQPSRRLECSGSEWPLTQVLTAPCDGAHFRDGADIHPKASVDNSVAAAACPRPAGSSDSILNRAAIRHTVPRAAARCLGTPALLRHYRGTGLATAPRRCTDRDNLYTKAPVATGYQYPSLVSGTGMALPLRLLPRRPLNTHLQRNTLFHYTRPRRPQRRQPSV